MNRDRHYSPVTLALIVVASLAAGSAFAADKTEINLTLTVDSSGAATINVDPEDATIWRNKPDKPKKTISLLDDLLIEENEDKKSLSNNEEEKQLKKIRKIRKLKR